MSRRAPLLKSRVAVLTKENAVSIAVLVGCCSSRLLGVQSNREYGYAETLEEFAVASRTESYFDAGCE